MAFKELMKEKAKRLQKKIVLPEGTESRTLQAARILMDEGLAASVTLVGKIDKVKTAAAAAGVNLEGINIDDPAVSNKLEAYAEEYYQLRKEKGITEEEAKETITDPLRWGAMMVRLGDADAMVAGAENSTGNVLRAAFTIIKTAPGVKSASSCFIMYIPDSDWGVNGNMVFSDCATIPNPTADQLAEIAIAASESCRQFLEAEPCTAMLSFSTKGSASHENVDKVIEATKLANEKRPDLNIDGELQLDAAIIPAIGNSKAPGSKVAGKANVLVFPDLQSGNIGYKLVQRLAGADAYGPFLQGFAKPVSDLSRGCSVDDIVITSAVTMAQSE
ncbi:MAG: phosphate acetyltransferase [Spirochaetales bacterium]|nr:phosphate acetyltransferase [Spirochaetales bacterium]